MEIQNSYSLYCLTFPNGKRYIGITNNFRRRMSQHKHEAMMKKKLPLYYAINKYGWKSIKKTLVLTNLSRLDAAKFEVEMISDLKTFRTNGYNSHPGGNTPTEDASVKMTIKMQNSEFRERALVALKSNEIKRVEALRTEEYCTLRSEIANKQFMAGKCKLPIQRKAILCVETGKIYAYADEAAKDMNLNARSIRRVASGQRKILHGYTFKFIQGN